MNGITAKVPSRWYHCCECQKNIRSRGIPEGWREDRYDMGDREIIGYYCKECLCEEKYFIYCHSLL